MQIRVAMQKRQQIERSQRHVGLTLPEAGRISVTNLKRRLFGGTLAAEPGVHQNPAAMAAHWQKISR